MSDNADIALAQRSLARTSLTFPQELVDWTIDFLHNDKATLRACSLVQRRWLSTSSFHLFSCFKWPRCGCHWARGRGSLQDTCECSRLLGQSKTLDELKSLLESSPRMRENVQELLITFTLIWHGRTLLRRVTSTQEIIDILDLLPHIRSLELHHLQFLPDEVPTIVSTPRLSLPSLRLARLGASVVSQDIFNLLSCFRHISTLSFYQTDLLFEPSGTLLHQPPPLGLETLGLTFSNNDATEFWIDKVCSYLDVTSLTTLSIRAPIDDMVNNVVVASPALHALLLRCTALRSLVCCGSIPRGLLTYQHACPTLRELRIVRHIIVGRTSTGPPWAKIQNLMGTPLAAAIRDVTFEMNLANYVEPDEPNPDASALERRFRQLLEGLDWTPVAAVVRRLRSVVINMEMKLWKLVREADEDNESTHIYNKQLSWEGDRQRYRAVLEGIVKERVPLSSHQRFDVHISLSEIP
ncbi:hypothetical protein PsYK624_026340 [Phanerochaete sordida]|uniref:F-box domain-containing protein n=1 Tax=Phanerochaete sordida TaxID=48140 RepID=A0A9P3G2P5_9APHY|nr:hypothetical protein PsYK624_026340 [Phanerochaete sordida]